METFPHLRIDLSTRNHMTFLTGCLQEFSMELYTDFEFHIADNAPTDPIYEACH